MTFFVELPNFPVGRLRTRGAQKTRVIREFNLSQPDAAEHEEHVHQLSVADIWNVAATRHPDVSFDREDSSVSQCVLSLCTPNLDFERGGCWRTRA